MNVCLSMYLLCSTHNTRPKGESNYEALFVISCVVVSYCALVRHVQTCDVMVCNHIVDSCLLLCLVGSLSSALSGYDLIAMETILSLLFFCVL